MRRWSVTNIALLLVPLAFSENNLMVKGPTENSVPFVKGAELTELKIGELTIVFGGLISQASCLDDHPFHTVSIRGHRISVACM